MIELEPLLRDPAAGFDVDDGIPILVCRGSEHARRQAEYFDEEQDADFEISRPHGTTRLYEWTLGEKFRRSVAGIEPLIPGATALTVCGGSGMEAELLARRGARVVCSDISLGAARRSRERARRHDVEMTPVVADAEDLPFADASFDLVYVHDGLHHLEHPDVALAEMARVACKAVSITEPASAALTRVAVRVGLALSKEPAGNVVVRFDPCSLAEQLRSHGFEIVRSERYGLYYRHRPGRLSRFLSGPYAFPIVTGSIRGANSLAGRVGNKLTVQAVRVAAHDCR